MLTRLSGTLTSAEGNTACIEIDALGMSFDVMLPSYLASALLKDIGKPISLYTLLQLDPTGQSGALSPRLIGFASERDRRFFELFTTVKGVGGKRALRAMAEPPVKIAGHIAHRDHGALQRLPEIGKRLAETIVAELHGKVDPFVDVEVRVKSAGGAGPAGDVVGQAIEALVRLGEPRMDAERRVHKAARQDPALESAEALLAASLSHGV